MQSEKEKEVSVRFKWAAFLFLKLNMQMMDVFQQDGYSYFERDCLFHVSVMRFFRDCKREVF